MRLVRELRPEVIFHLAAQVAVTTSVANPTTDFAVNAAGTLHVLEAARSVGAAMIFTSTNKVYGELEDLGVTKSGRRYIYSDRRTGVSEVQPLDFHSPYGCSKGAADQYVRDYARIYGLATVVFRMSCIYGTHQYGNEDQGWMAHFVRSAVAGQPITIYGDGCQVRDVLYIDDLLHAFDRARAALRKGEGEVFNIGGGPARTLAVWSEFGAILERLAGRPVPCAFSDWRPGDQRVYVSDISKAQRVLGWSPTTSVTDGIKHLWQWANEPVATLTRG